MLARALRCRLLAKMKNSNNKDSGLEPILIWFLVVQSEICHFCVNFSGEVDRCKLLMEKS
jgi:hypothetical protein